MSDVKGCAEPRVYTPPLRELTPDTTLGFDIIDFSREVLQIEPHTLKTTPYFTPYFFFLYLILYPKF